VVTEKQSAQNVMIFCRWKSSEKSEKKKFLSKFHPWFFGLSVPSSHYSLFTRNNNNETE